MCGYMLGHYHIHLRVRELAVAPSPINHVALRDNLFLSLILCEPHKAKAFRVARLCFSFHLRRGEGGQQVSGGVTTCDACKTRFPNSNVFYT